VRYIYTTNFKTRTRPALKMRAGGGSKPAQSQDNVKPNRHPDPPDWEDALGKSKRKNREKDCRAETKDKQREWSLAVKRDANMGKVQNVASIPEHGG